MPKSPASLSAAAFLLLPLWLQVKNYSYRRFNFVSQQLLTRICKVRIDGADQRVVDTL